MSRCTGHDDRELSLKAELEEPDELFDELLVSLEVNWGGVIHGVGSELFWEDGWDFEDTVVKPIPRHRSIGDE